MQNKQLNVSLDDDTARAVSRLYLEAVYGVKYVQRTGGLGLCTRRHLLAAYRANLSH